MACQRHHAIPPSPASSPRHAPLTTRRHQVSHGADATIADSAGMTPLMAAAEKGLWEVGLTLLRHGNKVRRPTEQS